MSVFGSVDQVASDINVNCGYLSITKDYVISKNSLLIMETSNDYVLVNGDFITASTVGEKEHLTAGIMELRGNFSQMGNSYSFTATGSHLVMFSGNEKQVVSFADPSASKFNKKDTSNSAGIIERDAKVTGVTITQNLLLGMWDSIVSISDFVYEAIDNPVQILEGTNFIIKAVSPIGGLTGERQVLIDSLVNSAEKCIEEMGDGNANIVARKFGRVIGDVILAVIADKGAKYATDAISKSLELGLLSKLNTTLAEKDIFTALRQSIFLQNAECVDDLIKAGIKSTDYLIKMV